MRNLRRDVAILALPALSNAVALSDMTPRATGLPSACNDVYTQEIAGCTPSDFQSRDCSQKCISGLEALVQPIQDACGGHGLEGENLVVAFLAGVGPQQICPNAPASTQPVTTKTSGTTTAHKVTHTSSLVVDTSSTMTETMLPSSSETTKAHTRTTRTRHKIITSGTTTASSLPTTSGIVADSSTPTSQTATEDSSPTGDSSQPIYDDGSGGGSPFDTEGNMMDAASTLSFSAALTLLSAMVALFATFR